MEYKGFTNLNNKEKINTERRKFIKKSLLGAAAFAASAKGLDKAFGFFTEDNKKEDKIGIDKIEKENPQSFPEEIEPEENPQEEKKEPKEMLSFEEKMSQEILRCYNSPAITRRFDEKVFTKDFFMAQQFQESRGDHTAESSAGARGVYQNKPKSVIDVVRFLAFLREKTKDLPEGERCDYAGPKDISEEEAKKISALFLEKADYGRSTGKLYLLSIHDKEYRYNNYPNPDVFRSKSPERQRELLLISYHDGPSCRRHPERASQEARGYVQSVKNHMNLIADIRDQLEGAQMSRDLDYAILKILRELDRKENRHKTKEVVNAWLRKLQEAHMTKWSQGDNFGKPLDNSEIRKLFAQR